MNSRTYQPSISFGFITAGKRNELLSSTIKDIQQLGIPEYEVLICGDITKPIEGTNSLEYPEAAQEGRLGAMRNRILEHAKHEVIVICDDDISFDSNFYSALRTYGDNYDVMSPKLLNADGSRYWDWAVYNSPTGHHLIPYNQQSQDVYVTGGICILKKSVTEKVRWPTDLGFYESEDIVFTNSLKQAGYLPKCNPQAIVIHNDYNVSQMEDFNIRLPNDNWVNHSSGLRLRGAFLGNPHAFSISQKFDIEVPSDLFKEPLVIDATFSLMAQTINYYPSAPIGEVYINEQKAGEIILNDEKTSIQVQLKIEPSQSPTIITIHSSALSMGAWNFASRCRSIESFLVKDLKLINSDGTTLSKSKLPKRQNSFEQKPYRLTKKAGLKFVGPLTCGNIESRILRSILPKLDEKGIEVGLEPRICTAEQMAELRTNKGQWLKYLTNDIQCGTRIEIIDQNRVPFNNYYLRHKEIWGNKNIALVAEEPLSATHFDGAFDDIINLKTPTPYFTPYNLIEQCNQLTPLKLEGRPKNLVAIELSPWDEKGMTKALHLIRRSFNRNDNIGFIMTSPEPHFWQDQPSISQKLQEVANFEEINLDLLPPITPLEGTLADTELFNIYRAMDAVIYLKDRYHPITYLPAILAKRPIITTSSQSFIGSVQNLGIEPILETNDSENKIKLLSEQLKKILNSRNEYDKMCEATYNTYTNCSIIDSYIEEILKYIKIEKSN